MAKPPWMVQGVQVHRESGIGCRVALVKGPDSLSLQPPSPAPPSASLALILALCEVTLGATLHLSYSLVRLSISAPHMSATMLVCPVQRCMAAMRSVHS